jgi:hypothetical protein
MAIRKCCFFQTGPNLEYQLLLLKKQQDNTFVHQLIYQSEELIVDDNYYLQFTDSNGDGNSDIALQFQDFYSGELKSILLFEQLDPATFSTPVTLAPDALNLNHTWENHLQIDFDQDYGSYWHNEKYT